MFQRGNILFLILLAIVLFAALSYAIMGQREQAPASMHKEQANSLAAALIQEASLLEQNVMRTKVVENIPDYGFDFVGVNSVNASNGTCTAMPVASTCRMIRTTGKSMLLTMPDWARTGDASDSYARFLMIQIHNVATSLDELVYLRGYLRKEVCEAINRGLGITNIDLSLPDTIGGAANRNYDGTLTALLDTSGAQLGEPSTGVAGIAGRNSFCAYNSSWGYIFVHVLIPR